MKKLTHKQLLAFNRKRRASGNKKPLAVGSCVRVGAKSIAAERYGKICRTRDGYFFEPIDNARDPGNYFLNRRELKTKARETSARIKKGVWIVYTGRPSWHQQQAGGTSSAVSIFTGELAKARAEEYAKNFRKHHPNEPATVQQER